MQKLYPVVVSFFIYIEIQTNVLARNACGHEVICEAAKSWAKYPQLHIYVSLIYDYDYNRVTVIIQIH